MLTLATREQHIRREKATSNICTAQVLLAVTAAMYAVYHGPEGLTGIAHRVHRLTVLLAETLRRLKCRVTHAEFFDTLSVEVDKARRARVLKAAKTHRINLRDLGPTRLGIALDETTSLADVEELARLFAGTRPLPFAVDDLAGKVASAIPERLRRTTPFCTHPVFHRYHSETEMLRYLKRLEDRDLSLTSAMIPLGSCTMKLNATAEMASITWPEFNALHPFAPRAQAKGYTQMFADLEAWLAEITGLPGVSLQPNAGAQGEYSGLLTIRAFHRARQQDHRTTCLIPQSAHGTNPATAAMCGYAVEPVPSNERGRVDIAALKQRLGPDVAGRYKIVHNDCADRDSHRMIGTTRGGNDIWVHREFLDCDVKIPTGFIEPHFFAGFSGGGKAIRADWR